MSTFRNETHSPNDNKLSVSCTPIYRCWLLANKIRCKRKLRIGRYTGYEKVVNRRAQKKKYWERRREKHQKYCFNFGASVKWRHLPAYIDLPRACSMLKSAKSFFIIIIYMTMSYRFHIANRNTETVVNILVKLSTVHCTFYVKWFMMTWWDVQCSQEICYFVYLWAASDFLILFPFFSISEFIISLFFLPCISVHSSIFYKCMNCISRRRLFVVLFALILFPYSIEEIVSTLAWFVVLSRILSPFSCVKNGRECEKRNGKFMFAPAPGSNLTYI